MTRAVSLGGSANLIAVDGGAAGLGVAAEVHWLGGEEGWHGDDGVGSEMGLVLITGNSYLYLYPWYSVHQLQRACDAIEGRYGEIK